VPSAMSTSRLRLSKRTLLEKTASWAPVDLADASADTLRYLRAQPDWRCCPGPSSFFNIWSSKWRPGGCRNLSPRFNGCVKRGRSVKREGKALMACLRRSMP
jgi:hypothetical protein